MQFRALEGSTEIKAAIAEWKSKFSRNAETRKGYGGTVYWLTVVGTWGHFGQSAGKQSDVRHYWVPFGRAREPLQDNMIVEINPPLRGIPSGVQGVIATDNSGNRWVLHGGRLHPKSVRITEVHFDALYKSPRATIGLQTNSRAWRALARTENIRRSTVPDFVAGKTPAQRQFCRICQDQIGYKSHGSIRISGNRTQSERRNDAVYKTAALPLS